MELITSDLKNVNPKYKAVVTAGAKDLVGNALDQKLRVPGNQKKVWSPDVRVR